MAIFIQGKTTCRICSQPLQTRAEMTGMPLLQLPHGLQDLADSCVHRRCLDAHKRRDEILQAWQQHWQTQAIVPGLQALANRHGIVVFRSRHFAFAALDSFVAFEEAASSFNLVRAFFTSFDRREPLSAEAAWNTYELLPTPVGVRLTATSNPPAPGASSVLQDRLLMDYEFTSERWVAFATAWLEFGQA